MGGFKIRKDNTNQDGKIITLEAFSLFSLLLSHTLEGFITLQGFHSIPGNFTKGPKD